MSVSQNLVHLKFNETLEKLKTIDQFSEENDWSLLEFRNYMIITCACLMGIGDKPAVIEYLDKLSNYTRKSKRWQQEIFVIEYIFSLYYAFLGEFKKANEALSQFIIADEMIIHLVNVIVGKNRQGWAIYENAGNSFTVYYHAACICAALEKYDDAVKLCDNLLHFDIDFAPNYSKEEVEQFYTMLKRVGINKESFKMLMSEVRKKRQCFVEKKDWAYHCKASVVSDQNNPDNKCRGFHIYLQWNQTNKINNTETTSPSFQMFYFNLLPTEIDEEEIQNELIKIRANVPKI
jgi:tetratricopeptide (TPR) repeat protein